MTVDEGSPPDPGSDARRERIDELVLEYVDRLNAGERLGRREIFERHPELAAELLEQLRTFVDLADDMPSRPLPVTVGDYTLSRQIGRGGMGVVYEAWEGAMDRRVALKVLPPGIAADQKAFLRFMREAKTAGQLSHPNVVSVYALGVKEQTPYYAMEYVEGATLAQIVARMRAAGWVAVTAFGPSREDIGFYSAVAGSFADVADGLQHAHSKGVVHRDIKPSNLILDASAGFRPGSGNGSGADAAAETGGEVGAAPPRLRILDFGLARLEGQESLSASGDVVGTPLYMSPEQARRRKVPIDHRTDVYSLGATLYEVLTLEPPFRGRDHEDTLSQIITRDPRPPRQLNPRAPRDLETIVLKCLRKEPGDRYGTAEALGQDLRRFVRGDPIEARAESGWERTLRRLVRVRRHVAFIIVVGALLIATGVLGLLVHRETLRRRTSDYENGIVRALVTLQLAAVAGGVPDLRGEAAQKHPSANLYLGREVLRVYLTEVRRAEAELARLEVLESRRPEARYLRARALMRLGRRDDALRDLELAARLAPDFLPAELFADLVRARGTAPGAEVHPVASRRPVWAEAWRQGYEALWENDYRRAAGAFGEIVDRAETEGDPYFGAVVEARLARCQARVQIGDIRALADIEWVRSRCTAVPELSILEAHALHLLGHADMADDVLQHLYESVPDAAKERFALLVIQMYLRLADLAPLDGWVGRLQRETLRLRVQGVKAFAEGRYEAAVEAASRAVALEPEEPLNYQALAGILDVRDTDKQERVIDEGLARHPDDPILKNWKAFVYFRRGRYEECERLSRELIEKAPEILRARDTLGCCLLRQGRAREALECFDDLVRNYPEHDCNSGSIYFCLGRLAESRKSWERFLTQNRDDEWALRLLGIVEERLGDREGALRLVEMATRGVPRIGRPFYHLGVLLERQGREREALLPYAEAQRLSPDRGFVAYRLGELLRSLEPQEIEGDRARGVIDALEATLETLGTMGAAAVARTRYLLALALLRTERPDGKRALSLAMEAVAGVPGRDACVLATLAEAQHATGDPGAAVRSLEEALRLPHATQAMADLLEAYRGSLGEIGSCASADWWRERISQESTVDPGGTLPAFSTDQLRGYYEAVLRLGGGDLAGAALRFAELAEKLPEEPEPLLRLAEATRRSGDIPRALQLLRTGLERFPDDPAFWREWGLASEAEPEATERALDVAPDPGGPDPATRTPERWVRESILWLLQELRRTGVVRINCGGSDFTDSLGRAWGTDRFFRGGWMRGAFELDSLIIHSDASRSGDAWSTRIDSYKFHGEIHGSTDDYFYQTNRWFYPREWKAGYAIPVPPGRYRLTLHFAEDWYQAEGLRRFSVRVEGQEFARDIDPFAEHGFAEAFARSGPMSVDDGLLEIEFASNGDYPFLAAIEVERVGG